jgi:hypothetical protein
MKTYKPCERFFIIDCRDVPVGNQRGYATLIGASRAAKSKAVQTVVNAQFERRVDKTVSTVWEIVDTN